MRFGSDFSLKKNQGKCQFSCFTAFTVTTYYFPTSLYAVQTFLWSLLMWKASSEIFATCVQSQTGHQELFMHLHLSLIFLSLGSQCLCLIHIFMSSMHPVSTPISMFENVICMAISLDLWWVREVEFHPLIRADVDLISLFRSGVDKLRGDIIYSLGCNSLFNHSHSQPG